MSELTHARLKQLLDYDPDTGAFTWKKPTNRRFQVGCVAGSTFVSGYRYVKVLGKSYREHRLAWFYEYGEWPRHDVDHINGIRDDNRIKNLRLAKSRSEQQQNQPLFRTNTSGYPGVCFHKASQKWRAQIWLKGKHYWLGLFDTPKDAGHAYRKAKAKLHKFNPAVRDFSYARTRNRGEGT